MMRASQSMEAVVLKLRRTLADLMPEDSDMDSLKARAHRLPCARGTCSDRGPRFPPLPP